MRRAIPTIAHVAHLGHFGLRIFACAWMIAAVLGTSIVRAQPPQGSIVAWGDNGEGQINVPAPNSGFIAIDAGLFKNLGLKADGSIVTWGANDYAVPEPNSGFIAVSIGWLHRLGLKGDGTVVAWGNNHYGQTNVPEPNTGFVGVAAGVHSLGLKGDGAILAWGCADPYNHEQCNVPAPNTGFIAVDACMEHSLGLKADGSIVAWGSQELGQINVPEPNTEFIAIATGTNHSLGLKTDGSIVAWGDNTFGQTDVPVPNVDFIGIAAGAAHSLGLKADGSIVAWGCGDIADRGQCNVPTPNTGFVAIAAGETHSLAIRATGSCCDTNGADRGCRDNIPQADCSDADETWNANASCAEVSCQCIPNCTGRECGDDGCGGNCGICDDGLFCNGVESCNPQGGCVAGIPPCHLGTEDCDNVTESCVSNMIPTVSEWGLVVLALLLLASAKLTLGRRSSLAA